ncbi:MAG: hypothetical protein ABI113_11545, partial [Mucilaginibacter sp.]
KWLPGFFRVFGPGVSYTTYHNAATLKLTDKYINLNPVWFQFQNGGVLSWYVIFTKQNLDASFNPLNVTINKGRYAYTRHKISVSSDPSKKISASLTGNLGQFYNGGYSSLAAAMSFAPSPYLFLSPNIEYGKLNHVGVSLVSKNVTLYSAEARIALNPRLQLSGLLQKSNVTNSLGTNVRLSWEFAPLSYFYIVFNNNSVSQDNSFAQPVKTVDRQTIVKLSYLKQF